MRDVGLDPSILPSLLRYVPETGNLFWLQRPASFFNETATRTAEHACASWNARWAGRQGFTARNKDGYHHGTILQIHHLAHRVIWALQTGAWPKDEIDHQDTDPGNNRWINLREATHAENMRNQRTPITNKSGIRGVFWHGGNQSWCAAISHENKNHTLGYFDSKEDAAKAYAEASARLHGNFGRITA